MEGITETDYGWHVRMCYCNGKPKYSEYFKYGECKETALERARTYRDAIIRRMGVLGERTSPRTRRKPQKNNTSGYLGITYVCEWGARKSDGSRPLYCKYKSYFVDENGKGRNLSFSCERYGDALALELAILTRKIKRRATEEDLQEYRRR